MNVFKKSGEAYIFATALGMVITLVMVFTIVILILVKGLGFFWPADVVAFKMKIGEHYFGEVYDEKTAFLTDSDGQTIEQHQIQLKIGNRDIYGRDFIWIAENQVDKKYIPENVAVFERMEYGNFYGMIREVGSGEEVVRGQNSALIKALEAGHDKALELQEKIESTEVEIAKLNEPLNRLLREISLLEHSKTGRTEEGRGKLEAMRVRAEELSGKNRVENEKLNEYLQKLYRQNGKLYVAVEAADGRIKNIRLADVVRFYQPNQMNTFEKSGYYAAKLWEFVTGKPRESNTEGGVFPAIYGTVLMVILMSIIVVPLGVISAIYLNEYAKQGTIVRLIRLSVNNLAGVPSIVFGIFGLGFFIYMVGGSIDQIFFSSKLPEPTFGTGGIFWASLTLALLTVPVVVVATEEGILAVPQANRQGALALGATKWQTIRDIVLPNAMPGILTGLILAVSRGAGEVAPLMITGVVKLAPSLPLDLNFPFLHLDRKFMHLGFHIYDVGFQSPNVEAAKPMVYMTALLLIMIVMVLNLIAIYLRNRLRRKFKTSTF